MATDTQKLNAEGVAYATILDAFPNLRKQHPKEFTSDVQTLYEYMLQPPKQGPGILHLHGKPHQQLTQFEAWLKQHPALHKAFATGDYTTASHDLGFSYQGGDQLPAPLYNGWLDPKQAEAAAKQHVASHGSILDRIGAGATDVGSGVASAAGSLGGIGDFLSKYGLIILLVVIVIIVKK